MGRKRQSRRLVVGRVLLLIAIPQGAGQKEGLSGLPAPGITAITRGEMLANECECEPVNDPRNMEPIYFVEIICHLHAFLRTYYR